MTSAGQCRLSPLIPLIQDSNQLYDFLVRIMFKLHGNLPNDVLQGHRDRFRAIFTQLKSFYNQSRSLQYFVNLITIPKLPETAPNFGSQVDFGSYTAPVVVVPEPEPEPEAELVGNLVDMSVDEEQHHQQQQQHTTPPPPALSPRSDSHNDDSVDAKVATAEAQVLDMKRIVEERDDLIRHLHVEIDRLGKCMKSLTIQTRDEHANLDQQVATLNSQLSDAHEQLVNMRFVKEELEMKAAAAVAAAQPAAVDDERLRAAEEKFTKMKVMYGQIRDEHVRLLRQHGDVSKQLAASTRTAGDATRERDEMRVQLEEAQAVRQKADEQLQQSVRGEADERERMAERLLVLETENGAFAAKMDDVVAGKEEQLEGVRAELSELAEKLANVETELLLVQQQRDEEIEKGAGLRRELDEVRSSCDKTEDRLQQSAEEAARERQEMDGQLGELQSNNAELLVQLEAERGEKAAVAEELSVVKEKLEQANEVSVFGFYMLGILIFIVYFHRLH